MKTYTTYCNGPRELNIEELADLYRFARLTYLEDVDPAQAIFAAKEEKAVGGNRIEKLIEEALENLHVNPFLHIWKNTVVEPRPLTEATHEFVRFLNAVTFDGIQIDQEIRDAHQELLHKRNLGEEMNAYGLSGLLKPLTLEALKEFKGRKIAVVAFSESGRGPWGYRGIHADEFIIESVEGNDNVMYLFAENHRNTGIFSMPERHKDGEFAYEITDRYVYFINRD